MQRDGSAAAERTVNLYLKGLLLLLVTVLSQTLLALVGGHLMSLTFFSAGHILCFLR